MPRVDWLTVATEAAERGCHKDLIRSVSLGKNVDVALISDRPSAWLCGLTAQGFKRSFPLWTGPNVPS